MNILLIVCDTLRADHLGCYGYFRDTSPNIDRIAEEGIVFKDFYTSGAPTGPAFTCLYTGLHTINHRHYQFQTPNIRQLDDYIYTMPEILQILGYTTAALDNLHSFIPHSKHWVRGYEHYINVSPHLLSTPYAAKAEQVNSRLIPWIKSHAGEKFFLFVHYWDPHLPYIQPQKYREIFRHEQGKLSDLDVKEAPAGYQYVPGWGKVGELAEGTEYRGYRISIDLYDGEIVYMDHAIGEIVATLEGEGVLEDTLTIITSDHGEQLGQHNLWEHNTLNDEVTHVPLIMRYPGRLPKGGRVKGFCQHIDVLPTVLDLIGSLTDDLERTLENDGESVIPLLQGDQIQDRIYMEHTSGERAIRTKEWKYIEDAVGYWWARPPKGNKLYRVKDDPMETINLVETEKEAAFKLKKTLHEWIKRCVIKGERDPVIYDELRELSLRSIRYREKTAQLLMSLEVTLDEDRKVARQVKPDSYARWRCGGNG